MPDINTITQAYAQLGAHAPSNPTYWVEGSLGLHPLLAVLEAQRPDLRDIDPPEHLLYPFLAMALNLSTEYVRDFYDALASPDMCTLDTPTTAGWCAGLAAREAFYDF